MAHFDGRGFRIHFVEEGSGPCVVFVHELGMDHTMYVAQFEELPENYRCLAVDLRGHGRSDCPPGPWTMQDLVVDLIRFIESTNAAPAHIVGLSLGGMVAERLAIQREDLVRSLVLIGCNADSEHPEWAQLYRMFQTRIEDEGVVSEEVARDTLPVYYGQNYIDAQPDAIEIHVDRLKKMKPVAVIEGLRAVLERDSVIERLGEITVPTLVIHGEQDSSISMLRAEALAEGIDGAELIKVPEVGHMVPVEAPDLVNEALSGFFSRVKR